MQSVKRDIKNVREPSSIVTNKVLNHKCDFSHKVYTEFTVAYNDNTVFYRLNNALTWVKVPTFEQLTGGGKITCVDKIKCDNGLLLIVGAAAPSYGGYVWVIKLSCGKLITHCFYLSYRVTTLASYYKPALAWAANATVLLCIGCESCRMYILNITVQSSANNKQKLLQPVDRLDKIFRPSDNLAVYPCYEIGTPAHVNNKWHYLLPSGASSGQYPGTTISSMQLHEMMSAIVVGYSIGCWQIWGVQSSQAKLWFTSLYQPGLLPVTHSVLLEPENDPQSYLFLWIVHSEAVAAVQSEASPTSAVIYQLQFKNKKETAKGHQFERLTELVERFHFNLSNTLFIGQESGVFKRLIDFKMIKKLNLFQGCNDFNGVTIIIETTKFIVTILFDLNAWYFHQLPSSVPPNAKLSPYISFLPINLSTIPKFCCLQGVSVLPESIFRSVESSSEACAIYPCSLNTTVRLYFGTSVVDALYLPDVPDHKNCDLTELSALTLKGIFTEHNTLLRTKKGKAKLSSFFSAFLPDLKSALNEAIEPVLNGLAVASREVKHLQHLVSVVCECYFLAKKVAQKGDTLTPFLFLHTHAYAKTILTLTDTGVLPAHYDHLDVLGSVSFPLPTSCISTLLSAVESVDDMWDSYPPRSIRSLLNVYYTKPLDLTLQTVIVCYSLMHIVKPGFDLAKLALLKKEDCNMVKAMFFLDQGHYDKFIHYLPVKSQCLHYCSVDSLVDILVRGKRKDVALQMLMLMSNKGQSDKINNLLSTVLSSENLLKLLETGSADSKTFQCILEEQFTHTEFVSLLKSLDIQAQFDCLFYVTLRQNKLCDLLSAYGEVQKTKKLSTSSFIEFMLEYTMRHYSDIELKSCLTQQSGNPVVYDTLLPLSAQACHNDTSLLSTFCIKSDLSKLTLEERTPPKMMKPPSPVLLTPPAKPCNTCDVSDELLLQLRTPHPTQTLSRLMQSNVSEAPRSILRSKKTEKKNRKRIRFGGEDEDDIVEASEVVRLSFGGAPARDVVSPEKKQRVIGFADPEEEAPAEEASFNVPTSFADTPQTTQSARFEMTISDSPDAVQVLDFSPTNPDLQDSFTAPDGATDIAQKAANCSFAYSDDEGAFPIQADDKNSTRANLTFAESTFGDEISFDRARTRLVAEDLNKSSECEDDTSFVSAEQTPNVSLLEENEVKRALDVEEAVEEVVDDDGVQIADIEFEVSEYIIPDVSVVIDALNTIQSATQAIIDLDNSVLQLDDSIVQLDDSIIQLDDSVIQLDDSVAEANGSVTESDDSVAEADDSVAEADDSVAEADDSVAEADDSVAEADDSVAEADDSSVSDIDESLLQGDDDGLLEVENIVVAIDDNVTNITTEVPLSSAPADCSLLDDSLELLPVPTKEDPDSSLEEINDSSIQNANIDLSSDHFSDGSIESVSEDSGDEGSVVEEEGKTQEQPQIILSSSDEGSGSEGSGSGGSGSGGSGSGSDRDSSEEEDNEVDRSGEAVPVQISLEENSEVEAENNDEEIAEAGPSEEAKNSAQAEVDEEVGDIDASGEVAEPVSFVPGRERSDTMPFTILTDDEEHEDGNAESEEKSGDEVEGVEKITDEVPDVIPVDGEADDSVSDIDESLLQEDYGLLDNQAVSDKDEESASDDEDGIGDAVDVYVHDGEEYVHAGVEQVVDSDSEVEEVKYDAGEESDEEVEERKGGDYGISGTLDDPYRTHDEALDDDDYLDIIEEPNLPTPADSEADDDVRSIEDLQMVDDAERPPTPAKSDSNDVDETAAPSDDIWAGFEENSPWGSEEASNPWVLEESEGSEDVAEDQENAVGTLAIISPDCTIADEEEFEFGNPEIVSDEVVSETPLPSSSGYNPFSVSNFATENMFNFTKPISAGPVVPTAPVLASISLSNLPHHAASVPDQAETPEDLASLLAAYVPTAKPLLKSVIEPSTSSFPSTFSDKKDLASKELASLLAAYVPVGKPLSSYQDVKLDEDEFSFALSSTASEHANVQISDAGSDNISFEFTAPSGSPPTRASNLLTPPLSQDIPDVVMSEPITKPLILTPPPSQDIAQDEPMSPLNTSSKSGNQSFSSASSFNTSLAHLITKHPSPAKYTLKKCATGQYKLESTEPKEVNSIEPKEEPMCEPESKEEAQVPEIITEEKASTEVISSLKSHSPASAVGPPQTIASDVLQADDITELLHSTTEQAELSDRETTTESPLRTEIFTTDDRPVQQAATRSRHVSKTLVVPPPEVEPPEVEPPAGATRLRTNFFIGAISPPSDALVTRSLRTRRTPASQAVSKHIIVPVARTSPEPQSVPVEEPTSLPKRTPGRPRKQPIKENSPEPRSRSGSKKTVSKPSSPEPLPEPVSPVKRPRTPRRAAPQSTARSSKRVRQKQTSTESTNQDKKEQELAPRTPTRSSKRKMVKKSNSSEEVTSPPAKSPSPTPTPSPPTVNLLPSRSTRSTRKAGVSKKESKKIEEASVKKLVPKARSTRKVMIEQEAISPPAQSSRDSLPIAESPTRNTRKKRTQLHFSDDGPAEKVKEKATPPASARSKRVKKMDPPQEVEPEVKEGRKAKKASGASDKRVTRSTRK